MVVLSLAFLRTLPTYFHSTNLHSHEQFVRILSLPAPSPTASLPAFVVCFIDDSHSDLGEMESQ
jgi:hypothetical protein